MTFTTLSKVTLVLPANSVADFIPSHWRHLDEIFTSRCPALATLDLVVRLYTSHRRTEPEGAKVLRDDPREHPVAHAIQVAVQTYLASTISRVRFRLLFATNFVQEQMWAHFE